MLTIHRQLILSLNGRFTLSDDSHGPLAVGLHYDKLYKYLKDRKLEKLWVLTEDKGNKLIAVEVAGTPWLNEWASLLEI